ncbi:putative CENP-B ARS binding protein-like protein [Lyophyllum shimeji]|uniref:CENP-B ARS binding protein-like protein n=1 Tax=Lyophyllum shimeji TaxID=47721 RepID=A0A9P3PYC5_LYOSH|nr:putative CENP-B ARS binding protein-like protein [Lyophyllum shimeji]
MGNLIDEEAVVDLLKKAADYERGLTRLTSQQKSLVEKLKELNGEVKKAVLLGNKRKRPEERKQSLKQRSKKPSLGFYYRNNAKAWMTAKIYQEWHRDWNEKLQQQNRHILLLQDNFSAHIALDDLTNICVKNCKPNLTAHIQPNDAGIIYCFKAHYRSKFVSRAIDRYDNDIAPALIYEIDQLEARSWLCASLTLRGASCPSREGCFELEELLNPLSEQELIGKVSEEEIFKSVQDMLEAEQMMEVNGGDDVDKDTVEVKPTRKEALTAAFTLQKYVADINEPFARKLEGILASFGRQIWLEEVCRMETTYDYFTRN